MADIFTNSNPLAGYSSSNPVSTSYNPAQQLINGTLQTNTSNTLTGDQIAAGFANGGLTLDSQPTPGSGIYDGSGTGTTATGSGSTAANAGSQADIATYTDNIGSLRGLLDQSDINRSQGEKGINDSYTTSNARLADQQAGVTNHFNTQETDANKGYQGNLNTIDNQARTGFQSLQSLLGGNGSASEILAPLAVSREAGTQTNNARDNFAGNLSALATARKDAADKFKNAQDDLTGQKNSKLQSLISSIDQQKQNYLSQIAQQENQLRIAQGGSYQTPTAQNADIAALQAEQNGLAEQYKAPAFTPQNVNVQAPNLNQYIAQAAQIGGGSNQPQGSAPQDPTLALQALLAKDPNKQYNPYGV